MAISGASTKALRDVITDPVCGMEVNPGQTRLLAIYRGHSYWFCSKDCRTAFEMNPRKYLDGKRAKRKGWLKRYLERIAGVNREEVGSVSTRLH
jgi:YHS domain-containing protein